MISPVRILLLILLFFFGYNALQVEFGGSDEGILSLIKYANLVIVILLAIPIILGDWKSYQQDKKIHQLSSSAIVFLIIAIVGFKIVQRDMINNSATRFSASNLAGAENVWTFDFKESGRFKLSEYTILGSTHWYGKYILEKDSIIKLSKSNYDGLLENFPITGTIKNDTLYWIGFDTMHIVLPEPK